MLPLFPWWVKYPNVNNEIQNLDWLLYTVKHLAEEVKNFINLNTIKYADPILWDITSQYEANTIVVDPQSGDAFISTKPVPYGVSLNNTDYWTKIYNYTNAINTLEEQIAAANEGISTTASAPRSVGDLVWLNGLLYLVTAPMIAGDQYVINSNVTKITIEQMIRQIETILNVKIGDLSDLVTVDKTSAVAAINELAGTLTTVGNILTTAVNNIGDLDNLATTDKTSLVNAINELFTAINNEASIIDTINSKLKGWDVRTNGKIIFLGDSYGKWDVQPWPKWTDNVAQLLGLGTENTNWWNLAAPSTALANGDFLNAITTWVNNHPDQVDEIGAVVICSGINDAATVYLPNIYTQINALATFIKNNLPKATAYIGYIGWLDESTVPTDTRIANLREQVAEAYMRAESFGMRYLNGVENFYHDKRIVIDGIHPTSDGAVRIAEGIVNALTIGAASVANHFSASPTAYEGTIGGTYSQHLQNGIITTSIDGIGIDYGASPKTVNAGDNLAIANCNTAFSNGVDFGLCNISITSGGVNMTALGRLYIDKNTNILYFKVFSFSSGNAYETLQYINGIYAIASQSTLQC